MKYIVILLLIIVLIFLFNIKETWTNKIKPVDGEISAPDTADSNKIIDFILSKDEYTQKIKTDVINNYKKRFKNLNELSKSLETVEKDINKQLKKIFIEDLSKNDNLVDNLTNKVKKNTDLIKGEVGTKGDHGALTSNPDGEVVVKSLNIGADKTIDNNFVNQFDNTIQGNNPVISKSNVYLGDIEKDDVITDALFTDNLFIGNKHIKSKDITDFNNKPTSAFNFAGELRLNTLKLGNNEIKEDDNNLKFNNLKSNNLHVNNLTVKNTKFKDIKSQGDKGDTGVRGPSINGGSIYKDVENRENENPMISGQIDFSFIDGTTETRNLYGKIESNDETNNKFRGKRGLKGFKGNLGNRGDSLTSGSFDKNNNQLIFNDRAVPVSVNLVKGDRGNKGETGIKGLTGKSLDQPNSYINNYQNDLYLVQKRNTGFTLNNILLPTLKGDQGDKGVLGNKGTDYDYSLFDENIELNDADNILVFKSPVKINKNFCFQNSDDSASKFCLSKNSFTHDYLMMENVLNMLGVDMNTYNDISQLEYIIRLNAQKLGYGADKFKYDNIEESDNFNNILDFVQESEFLRILNKFEINLHGKTIEEALERVNFFKEILNINEQVYNNNIRFINPRFLFFVEEEDNGDFYDMMPKIIEDNDMKNVSFSERKKILEQILLVDNLFKINLSKTEINDKIVDFLCHSKLLGFRGRSSTDNENNSLCVSWLKEPNNFNDQIKDFKALKDMIEDTYNM